MTVEKSYLDGIDLLKDREKKGYIKKGGIGYQVIVNTDYSHNDSDRSYDDLCMFIGYIGGKKSFGHSEFNNRDNLTG